MDDLSSLTGVTGRREFAVEPRHATSVFGEQADPPALPAALASPDEVVEVLGTPFLLSFCEFVGRESLRGHLPEGTGTVGERADVRHRRAATVGTTVVVETDVVDVDGTRVELTATVSRATDEGTVGTATLVFRVVDRERFRASL
ncbi:thioesterase, FlK family [Halomarina ordinaria]|uniref:Hotdog domain-containing protein n=1 Tax=Halomarina ordinaria TaxID=3033939 RepID=A0ABD5UAJ4_9EURY|nr:hotdog domain-containing protein [Halomarina sp. PSRA2]